MSCYRSRTAWRWGWRHLMSRVPISDKLREGVALTLQMLTSAMDKAAINEVNPQGERFDPDFHQAMSMQERDDVEPNTVVTVVQKGYTLNGRLIRPAMVIVSKAPAASS